MMTKDVGDDVPRGPLRAEGAEAPSRGPSSPPPPGPPADPPPAGPAGPQRISGSAVPVGAAPDARAAPLMHRRRPSAQARRRAVRPRGPKAMTSPAERARERGGAQKGSRASAGSGPPGSGASPTIESVW